MSILDHGVKNVGELHIQSGKLYSDVVVGKADSIIANLSMAIKNLKENWKGADAGVNIKDVIDIYNEIVDIRNLLANLAKDSNVIAVGYREIQDGNRARLGSLTPISIVSKNRDNDPYSDTSDTIYITPGAAAGKDLLGKAAGDIQSFVETARIYKNEVLDNWYKGPGRNQADDAFDAFDKSSKAKQAKLEEVANIVGKAVDSYGR